MVAKPTHILGIAGIPEDMRYDDLTPEYQSWLKETNNGAWEQLQATLKERETGEPYQPTIELPRPNIPAADKIAAEERAVAEKAAEQKLKEEHALQKKKIAEADAAAAQAAVDEAARLKLEAAQTEALVKKAIADNPEKRHEAGGGVQTPR